MKAEFYQDENGKIWFFNASDIWLRTTKKENFFLKAAESIAGLDHQSSAEPTHRSIGATNL